MSDTPLEISQSAPLTGTDRIEIPTPSLRDVLPLELANDPSLVDFKDFTSLAKSYLETKKYVGSSIRIPTSEASDEAKLDFFSKIGAIDNVIIKPKADDTEALKAYKTKIGIPTSEDGYTYTFEEGTKLPVDETFIKNFNKFALDHDLTKDQAEKMFKREIAQKSSDIEAKAKSEEASKDRLKVLWGDAYKDKLAQAESALGMLQAKMGDDIKNLKDSGALTNPALMIMLADIGVMSAEKTAQGISYKPMNKTPDDAQREIRDILSNPKHPYMDNYHRDHKRATEQVAKLYQMAYPDQANR